MSKLRDGIHLRSYAQTNPLQAYVQEGYKMFEDMIESIADEVASSLLRVQIQIKVAEQENGEQQENPQETNK